jgi:PAS domain S-box-containing protein
MEESLEALLNNIIESLPFDFWAMDGEKLILQNSKSKEHWGDNIGKSFPEVIASETKEPWNEIRTKIYKGDVLKEEVEFSTKEGKKLFFEKMIAPILNKGIIRGIIGVNLDITDLKNTANTLKLNEQNFRNIFSSSSEGIALLNNDLRFIDINEPIVKWSEYPNEEILGMHILDFISNAYHSIVIEMMKDLMETQAPFSIELEVCSKSGKKIPVEIHCKLIQYNGQESIMTIIQNISEQRNMQKMLIETIMETEERERKRIAGDLHDELGPLLASMRIYASTLSRKLNTPEQIEINDTIISLLKSATTNIRAISNNLSPHTLEAYGLVAAINTDIENLNNILPIHFKHNIEKKRFENKIEIAYYRIIKELVNNTLKYASAKRIHLVLDFNNGLLTLIYSDDGIGFNYDELIKKEHPGIGILNIHARIRSISGSYKIDSSEGKGFNFELTSSATLKTAN